MPVLAQAGFRAIAPDLRGYGDSDKPTGVKEYAFKNVLQDIIGILQQLKVDRYDAALMVSGESGAESTHVHTHVALQ